MNKILVITNMYPSKDNPIFGIFVKNSVTMLSKHGVHSKIAYSRGFMKNIRLFLKTLLIKRDYNIIHSHYILPCGFIGAVLKALTGKKLVITSHGSDIDVLAEKNFIYKHLTKYSLKKADKIIVVGSYLKNKVKKFGINPNKVKVIPCGTDQNIFKSMNKTTSRKKLNLPLNKKIVLFVGTIVAEKDPKRIVSIAKQMPDRLFVLVGDGYMRKEIKSYNLSNLKVIGNKPQKEIPLWMNAADCLILPSKEEGFGLVLVESMMCNLPVIATNIGGIPDIIDNNKNGIITNDFVSAIKKLDNKTFRQKIIKNAMKKVKQNYTWDIVTKKMIDTYETI